MPDGRAAYEERDLILNKVNLLKASDCLPPPNDGERAAASNGNNLVCASEISGAPLRTGAPANENKRQHQTSDQLHSQSQSSAKSNAEHDATRVLICSQPIASSQLR